MKNRIKSGKQSFWFQIYVEFCVFRGSVSCVEKWVSIWWMLQKGQRVRFRCLLDTVSCGTHLKEQIGTSGSNVVSPGYTAHMCATALLTVVQQNRNCSLNWTSSKTSIHISGAVFTERTHDNRISLRVCKILSHIRNTTYQSTSVAYTVSNMSSTLPPERASATAWQCWKTAAEPRETIWEISSSCVCDSQRGSAVLQLAACVAHKCGAPRWHGMRSREARCSNLLVQMWKLSTTGNSGQ